jgi:plasmid stabilization system protein ParE
MRSAAAILDRLRRQFGVLLSDDVGLGKTLVALLVAGVFAGKGKRVRILAPNQFMRRKWELDARDHFNVLGKTCRHLDIDSTHLKSGAAKRLREGGVQVATHGKASKQQHLSCDLLIVDEAHRARGDQTIFRSELKRQRKSFGRVLFLTATPFSIAAEQLCEWLRFLGAPPEDRQKVRLFARLLERFWGEQDNVPLSRSLSHWTRALPEKRAVAIEALRKWVIRHSVEDLGGEKKHFGDQKPWAITCPSACENTLEVLLRSDRMLRLAKRDEMRRRSRTNDLRFHVGWSHLRHECNEVSEAFEGGEVPSQIAAVTQQVIEKNVNAIRAKIDEIGEHPKIRAVADEIARVVREDEKVIVFCHHHATAAEVALVLQERLPAPGNEAPNDLPNWWGLAWLGILRHGLGNGSFLEEWGKEACMFVGWLHSPVVLRQITSWIGSLPTDSDPEARQRALINLLVERRARQHPRQTVAESGTQLFDALGPSGSRSTQGVLRYPAQRGRGFLAGRREQALPTTRVLALTRPPHGLLRERSELSQLFWQGEPDTPMAIFNSPFGPDVLVATDRLSEGVDLHRYCRHVVHYELSPSPIRVIQRNGRLRRLGSWASITKRPIRIAYPEFCGTRDERLVEIMRGRLRSFDMLLGGAGREIRDEALDDDEQWKLDILNEIRKESKLNAPLAVRR